MEDVKPLHNHLCTVAYSAQRDANKLALLVLAVLWLQQNIIAISTASQAAAAALALR